MSFVISDKNTLSNNEIEVASDLIYKSWLSRNSKYAEEGQKLPYQDLPEEEKEKDRVLARNAAKILRINIKE